MNYYKYRRLFYQLNYNWVHILKRLVLHFMLRDFYISGNLGDFLASFSFCISYLSFYEKKYYAYYYWRILHTTINSVYDYYFQVKQLLNSHNYNSILCTDLILAIHCVSSTGPPLKLFVIQHVVLALSTRVCSNVFSPLPAIVIDFTTRMCTNSLSHNLQHLFFSYI